MCEVGVVDRQTCTETFLSVQQATLPCCYSSRYARCSGFARLEGYMMTCFPELNAGGIVTHTTDNGEDECPIVPCHEINRAVSTNEGGPESTLLTKRLRVEV
jgi:hypothetical protein